MANALPTELIHTYTLDYHFKFTWRCENVMQAIDSKEAMTLVLLDISVNFDRVGL